MSALSPDRASVIGASARPRDALRAVPLLPAAIARMIAFAALATFGAAHWARFVDPAATLALLGCVAVAVCAGIVALRIDGRSMRARMGGVAVIAAALLALAALVAGIRPALLLDPRNWDDLVRGIGEGLGALSTAVVPYSGLDEWTRTVLLLGGSLLTLLAGLLAFLPRSDGAHGRPIAAAIALGALYAVPAIELETDRPFVAGAGFALLLAAFLWLERVQRVAAPAALGVVTAACLLALAAAPRLNGPALLDYEQLGESLTGSVGTSYDWNHGYGPLNWPRDGREVLRVRARDRAYWKAASLTSFDGVRWREDPALRTQTLDTPLRRDQPDWHQRISVTLRALRSTRFVAAGTTLQIAKSPRQPVPAGPGLYETDDKPLRRGNTYDATVYAPRPTAAEMRASTRTRAGTPYPESLRRRYSLIGLPAVDPPGPMRSTGPRVAAVPQWGEQGAPLVFDGASPQATRLHFARTPYARMYALARRLRARSATPYDFVRAIERHLADGFAYSETPRRSSHPLQSFLFGERAGYCQQFSGAMALLLRLGGVPARIAAGFSPGSPSSERGGQYVVRDIDAHSWVEVYFPDIGWVTRDPTPAGSPARSQTADLAPAGQASSDSLGSESSSGTPGSAPERDTRVEATAPQRHGFPWMAVATAVAALALLTLAALLVWRARRRRRAGGEDPWLADLRRALRRSGRAAKADVTLEALARRFAGTPAEGYLRGLAAVRYGYGTGAPTRAQRSGLRRELARGLGAGGRLRAWWALPPQI